MGKLNRYLAAALVIQIAILLAITLSSSGPRSTVPTKVLGKLNVEKVTSITVEDNNKKKVVLQKREGRWVLASGGGYPARKDKVTEFLGKLAALTARQTVTTSKVYEHKLEVADDNFQRRVALKVDGGKDLRFLLGSSPGIKSVHLRMVGSDAVLEVGELTAWDATTTASDWVASDYFKLDKDSVVSLRLNNASGDIALDRGPDGGWIVAGMEEGATVKKSEIDSMLGSLSAITLQEPVSRTLEPRFGLDEGKRLALVTVVEEKKTETKDKKEGASSQPVATPPARVTHTLTVGAKDGNEYFVKSEGSDYVVKVGSWAVESLIKKKASDLWETKTEDKGKDGGQKEAQSK